MLVPSAEGNAQGKQDVKRYGNLFHLIADKGNIESAAINAAKGKIGGNSKGRDEILEVLYDLEFHVDKLHRILLAGSFMCSEYSVFPKKDKGKLRHIYVLPFFPDRVLQHAILQILEPIWKKTLIADTFQSISGRGVHSCLAKIRPAVQREKMRYCLQIDVKKFYPSICNDLLKVVVRKKIKCRPTLNLIDSIIDGMQGVPIGNYLSQYLANLFLSDLDHKIKEVIRVKYYYRYCDDLIVLSSSKEDLWNILDFIRKELHAIKLKVKENYQVYEINDIRGVNCFGYTVHPSYVRIRKSIAKEFHRKLKVSRINGYLDEDMVSSYFGWFKHCDGAALWNSLISGLWPKGSPQQNLLEGYRDVLYSLRTKRSTPSPKATATR